MTTVVAVRFLDEEGTIREGELVNPSRVRRSGIDVEFHKDNRLSVYCPRSNGEWEFFETHASRVTRMKLVPVGSRR